MGLERILFRLPCSQLPYIIMLRLLSNRKITVHLIVRIMHETRLTRLKRYRLTNKSIIWAVVLACHGAASGFVSLLVLRILLGMLESTVTPGLSLMTAIWYKRSEHTLRHGIWFAGNCIASIFGGVLAYGIGHIDSSIESWRVRISLRFRHQHQETSFD